MDGHQSRDQRNHRERFQKFQLYVIRMWCLCQKNVYGKYNFYSYEKWNMTCWLNIRFFPCVVGPNQRCFCLYHLHFCVTKLLSQPPCLECVAGLARTGFCLINCLHGLTGEIKFSSQLKHQIVKLSKAEACCRPNTRSCTLDNSFVKLTESC